MADVIYVTKPSMPTYEKYCEEIRDLWDSHWLSNNGKKKREFQDRVSEILSTDRVELTVNCHMALELSLKALQLQGEVITTPFTFASTIHAITRNGLRPVFCDIDPKTFTLDPADILRKITPDTCAIMPVHVYGNICDVQAIQAIAEKHHLKVIYDAAHAFGEKWQNQSVGSFGDVSCFSFHATKVFNSAEGGAACFQNQQIRQRFSMLLDFGIKDEDHVALIGVNAKMNELSAAMGLCNLRHYSDEVKKRKIIDRRYRENLEGVPGITLRFLQPEVVSNYAYFPIMIDPFVFGASRNHVQDILAGHNIYTRKYFFPLASDYECYRGLYGTPDQTPKAQMVSERILALPMYADLSLDDVDRICDLVRSVPAVLRYEEMSQC
jgi:dTDP-4-amino-4,6-dideoxygalactose transaminase